jgi:FkbM family methyltransferase
MKSIWGLLKYMPPSVLSVVKNCTSSRLRLWIRQNFGANYADIPNRIVTVADGRKFKIGPDCIYWALHMGLEFEPEASGIVRRLVHPGDTVVDVGANFGWYSTLCAAAAGPAGKVFAFEPVPSTYQRLLENLRHNQFATRVTAVRSAVGQQQGEVTVYVFDHLSHSCASLSTLDQDQYQAVSAPLIDLDSFLAAKHVENVDFLKCDVEGSELAVLQGCRKLLSKPDAPLVLVELNADTSRAFGFQKDDIWQLLRDQGYDHFYAIQSPHNLRRVQEIREIRKLHLLLAAKGETAQQRMAGSPPQRALARAA